MKQLETFEQSFKNKLCRLGFGGIPLQGLSLKESDTLLNYTLDRGINFFDTARGYSDSESKIGRIAKERREEMFLATKSMARSYEAMKQDISLSMENLNTDHIELYQLHGIGTTDDLQQVLDPETGALRALQEAQANKSITFIGITGHTSATLVTAVKTGLFDSVQIPHNIIERECEEELIPLCKSKNIPVIAMKPVGGGAFKEVVSLNLRFILNAGSTIAIPGMDSTSQVEANSSILPAISPLSMDEESQLSKEKERWQGSFCRRCGYCLPCPAGLKIPFLLLLDAYWERYDLKEWVLDRLAPLEKKFSDCQHCGECMNRCPYNLPITEMMNKAEQTIEKSIV